MTTLEIRTRRARAALEAVFGDTRDDPRDIADALVELKELCAAYIDALDEMKEQE